VVESYLWQGWVCRTISFLLLAPLESDFEQRHFITSQTLTPECHYQPLASFGPIGSAAPCVGELSTGPTVK